ncbi:MAG: histidine kinase dimerization/phospho-acceptor domain-containing protein, partial [Myxococcota bacterium]
MRAKLPILAGLVVLVMGALAHLAHTGFHRSTALAAMEERAAGTARLLAAAAVPLLSRPLPNSSPADALRQMARTDNDILYIYVIDSAGRTLTVHDSGAARPPSLADPVELVTQHSGQVLHISAPIRPTSAAATETAVVSRADRLGNLRLGVSVANIASYTGFHLSSSVFAVIALALLAAALTAVAGALSTRRFRPLIRAARELGQGNLAARVDCRDGGDLGELAAAFNQMAEQLGESFAVSERMNRELEAVNAELEAFSYSVSHDLKAPLRAMDGFSQLLLDSLGDKLDDRPRDYLRRIRRGANKMRDLIDALLKLAQVTRAPLREVEVDLSALAEEVIAELREAEPEREAEVSIASGVVGVGDAALVKQVLHNLLSNAWKFTATRATARIE